MRDTNMFKAHNKFIIVMMCLYVSIEVPPVADLSPGTIVTKQTKEERTHSNSLIVKRSGKCDKQQR